MVREVMCSERKALICAMRDPGTTGGYQICRRGKARSCVLRQRKRKPAHFPHKQMEEVWKMKEGSLATNSFFHHYALLKACKYCNLK